jgi:4-hydroxyphenylpyruvate dioxygenase
MTVARQIEAIGYLHFFVTDADFWSQWFCECLDFELISSDLIENQINAVILQQGNIQIRISDSNRQSSNRNLVGDYLAKHPPGIAEIGLLIPASDDKENGVTFLNSPDCDLVYRLVSNSQTQKPKSNAEKYKLFSHIDHIVINLPCGKLAQTAEWYEHILGMTVSDRFNIQTDRSGLKSLVLENQNRNVQIPLNQPSSRNSQIQEFLDYNRGSGVQHLALHTDQIERTVDILKQRGVKFLPTLPEILYEEQDSHTGKGILQIFTQPLFEQPTFFLEIIQRREGARGFGAGNFQALFEAIEREQLSRSFL